MNQGFAVDPSKTRIADVDGYYEKEFRRSSDALKDAQARLAHFKNKKVMTKDIAAKIGELTIAVFWGEKYVEALAKKLRT